MKNLEGIMCALVTPLTPEGNVDSEKMEKLVEFQIEKGIHSLLVLGGTGEYSALSMEEREAAVKAAVKASAGRVPVVAGVLEPGIGECMKFCKACIEAGADALLVLTPFYIHPTQEGIYNFYKKLNDELQFPILIYNIPYKTSVNCLAPTTERILKDLPHVFGMKECCPDFSQALDDLRRFGETSCVLSGEEFLATQEMLCGAKGAIMATANLVPEVWLEIYGLVKEGKAKEAREKTYQYFDLFKMMFAEVNPGPLKYAMGLAGLDVGSTRVPLVEPSDGLKSQIKAEMIKLGIIE